MRKRTLPVILFACVLLVPSVLILSGEFEKLRIALRHRSAGSVAPRLSEELTSGGRISLDAKKNALTVTDEAPVVEKIRKMAAELDVPARRFAVSAALSVFAERSRSVFREDERLTDISDFLEKATPAEKYEGVLDLLEGKGGSRVFGQNYLLSMTLGGYDPWERKLSFESISLEKRSVKAGGLIFKGSANLAEGSDTSIVIPPKDGLPAVSLSINPTLLPSIDKNTEIP